jgi:DNA invertase Pin-like site-specific DNA recombinase
MPLAVLYARFSPRPNAEECDSVEKQLERCRAYSLGHGYTVVAEHHDKDVSGERADNRPGLQKAITAACDRKAVLCVFSLSRLARCTKDAIDLAERLSAAGADLAVIQENVNTRSPMGRFIFTLFSALAQLERE